MREKINALVSSDSEKEGIAITKDTTKVIDSAFHLDSDNDMTNYDYKLHEKISPVAPVQPSLLDILNGNNNKLKQIFNHFKHLILFYI